MGASTTSRYTTVASVMPSSFPVSRSVLRARCRAAHVSETSWQTGRRPRICRMNAGSSRDRHVGAAAWAMLQTFAHISDLYLGAGPGTAHASRRLCSALVAIRVERVIVTGDVTDRGRRAELELFRSIFAPLFEKGRMVVVPGNHDRLGDDVAGDLQGPQRVQAEQHGDLYVVRFDSTGPHNRRIFDSHGQMQHGPAGLPDLRRGAWRADPRAAVAGYPPELLQANPRERG